jgi:hypothetical protein
MERGGAASGPSVFRAVGQAELDAINASGVIKSSSSMALPIEKKLGLTAVGSTPEEVSMYAKANLQNGGKAYVLRITPSPDMSSEWTQLPKTLAKRDELKQELETLPKTLAEKGPDWSEAGVFRKWIADDQKELADIERRLSGLDLSGIDTSALPTGVSLPYRQTPRAIPKERITAIYEQDAAGKLTDVTEQMGFVVKQRKPPFTPTPETETMWQAFRWSLEKAADQAYKTHFFNPERGFLERTLNHPYLGLYPLSYMWGKVLPEFARFLLAKPFGLDAPLLGWDAAQHVQEAMLVQMNDPEFAKQMQDNKGLIYLIQLMLPATPENIPVNAPAWARHAAAAAAGGRKWNPGTELADLPQNIGVMRMIPTLQQGLGPSIGSAVGALGGAIGDRLSNDLDLSAKLYDSNVAIQPVLRHRL